MINIQHYPLSAFKKDALLLSPGIVKQAPCRIHVRQYARRYGEQLPAKCPPIHFSFAEPAPQRVVVRQQAFNFGFQ